MKFDESKAFSALNADEVKVGSIGYVANTADELYFYVTHNSQKKVELTRIECADRIRRFIAQYSNGENSTNHFFYLLEEPKAEEEYRPYKDIDELINTYWDLTGIYKTSFRYPQIWVKDVNTGVVRLITEYGTVDNTVRTGDYWCTMEELLEDYTYLDGSKCGVKNE